MLMTSEWMSREEIAKMLGIVPNSVRGKVQKGQIERKIEDGKNLYRVVSEEAEAPRTARREPSPPPPTTPPEPVKPQPVQRPGQGTFNPRKVLLEQLAALKVDRNIDAIEKGDEIDLATGEISRELDAKITMRHYRQVKEIQDALERLKLGEYGTCEECGEPVPEQRLRLFPAARLCVRCQEEQDHLEKLREAQGLRGGAWREESSEGSFSKSFED